MATDIGRITGQVVAKVTKMDRASLARVAAQL